MGRPLGPADSGFWRWYFGSDNHAGKTVTAQTALLSVIWGCVRLLSQVVGTLPGFLYVRDGNGRRRLAARSSMHRRHRTGWPAATSCASSKTDPPYEGGEIFTVQSNLILIQSLGQQSEDRQAKSALQQWLGLPTFEDKK